MAITYTSLITDLRRQIQDEGLNIDESFIGDGSTTIFNLNYTYFKTSTDSVYLDNVLTSTGYSISNNRLIFTTAPGVDVSILILYQFEKNTDTQINNYIKDGIGMLRIDTSDPWGNIDTGIDVTDNFNNRNIISLATKIRYYKDKIFTESLNSVNIKEADITIDRRNIVQNLSRALEIVEEEYRKVISQYNIDGGGYALL